MDSASRRRLTDATTLARVPLAVALVMTRRRRAAATAAFALGAASDVIDGPLARRLGTASERGARLDSAADAVFVAASAVAVARTIDRTARPLVLGAAGLVAATRAVTLVATRWRFARWSVAHTHLNKATGAALTAVAVVALPRGRMPMAVLAAAAVLAEIAALEELAIVATSSDYDPDRASLSVG